MVALIPITLFPFESNVTNCIASTADRGHLRSLRGHPGWAWSARILDLGSRSNFIRYPLSSLIPGESHVTHVGEKNIY